MKKVLIIKCFGEKPAWEGGISENVQALFSDHSFFVGPTPANKGFLEPIGWLSIEEATLGMFENNKNDPEGVDKDDYDSWLQYVTEAFAATPDDFHGLEHYYPEIAKEFYE